MIILVVLIAGLFLAWLLYRALPITVSTIVLSVFVLLYAAFNFDAAYGQSLAKDFGTFIVIAFVADIARRVYRFCRIVRR
jgi:hypothetical protein